MSLPPGFLEELRSRISLSQVVGRKVTWDSHKSQPGKGDMWAPCPFHQEKTASFHVVDSKGFYHCFGCHAKGDAISFVRESENVGFMDAVEILAREAGMTMPARDPKAQEKADRFSQLAEVMEQAVQFFRLRLRSGAGTDARAYLQRRGLDEAALERWEIGFAPEGWQNLWDHLRGKGVAEDLIIGAGLAKPSQKGGKPYDTFRNRIMFPIRDARGRAIAFGGRAMDPDENAKYLNSPQTELFDKSRTLFNQGPARAAAGRGQPVIVAEGYMDVIALAEAGFEASVAPLGTAVTETQLQMLWRMSDEPVIALDGDKAGLNAAYRVIDLALPMLEAGKSLRFAIMPEGKDPDDLLRAEGAGAVQAVLEAASPMVDLLWRRETDGKIFDSPERKAALRKALAAKVALIQDPLLRGEYERALKDLTWEFFRPVRNQSQQGGGTQRSWKGKRPGQGAIVPLPTTRSSDLVDGDESVTTYLRESVIFAVLIGTPSLVEEFEDRLLEHDFSRQEHREMLRAILAHAEEGSDAIRAAIASDTLENLFGLRHVAINPAVLQSGNELLARDTVDTLLKYLQAFHGHFSELEEAVGDEDGLRDETGVFRLKESCDAKNQAELGQQEDKTEYETGDNGAQMNRAERAALDDLLKGITYSKSRS